MWIAQIEEVWRNLSRFKKRWLFCAWLVLLSALSFILLKHVFLRANMIQTELDLLQQDLICLKAKPLMVQSKQSHFPNFEDFVECCSKSHIDLMSLKPGPQKNTKFLSVHLVLKGRYQSILGCIEHFNQGSFSIRSFDMKVAKEGLAKLQIDLVAYFNAWQVQKNLNLSAVKDPFQRKAPKDSMSSYDLSQLRLLGIICDHAKYYAIVADPSNKLYSVVEGSFLGADQARVLSIQDGELKIKTQDGDNIVLKLREH